MELCLSSSGCETRPVRGQPAHTGSEPCGERGNARADAGLFALCGMSKEDVGQLVKPCLVRLGRLHEVHLPHFLVRVGADGRRRTPARTDPGLGSRSRPRCLGRCRGALRRPRRQRAGIRARSDDRGLTDQSAAAVGPRWTEFFCFDGLPPLTPSELQQLLTRPSVPLGAVFPLYGSAQRSPQTCAILIVDRKFRIAHVPTFLSFATNSTSTYW